jgi:glycosyltransferase involved in cell wall biosynthesis
MQPQVSVVIPTFNRAHLITRAIRSVLSQGIENIEIIVVDDASNDDTEDTIQHLNDCRIYYIKLEKNGGASRARNIGVSMARGEIVAFLDSDDEWLLDMLDTTVSELVATPECDAVFAGFIRFYDRSPEYIFAPNSAASSSELLVSILLNNFITPQVLVIKKQCFTILGGFDESLSHREDWDFGVRLLANCLVKPVNRPLAIVYETPGNLTSMTLPKIKTLNSFIQKHFHLFRANPLALAKHYLSLGHSYMLVGDYEQGRLYIGASLKIHPRLKAIAQFTLSIFGLKMYLFMHKLSRRFVS